MARKSVISIDVGTRNTKIIVGRFEKNCIYIEKALLLETPQGSIMDGRLINVEGKAESLKQRIMQKLAEHRIKSKDAIFTIESTLIIRRELEVPNVKPHELISLIRYEIQQYLPIDLNEYIIEQKVLEEIKDNKLKIVVAALPKTIAEDYLNFINSMKLEPVALDISSNAVAKLFGLRQQINNASYNLDNTAAFIDMGCSNICVTIMSKGIFQFSRLIPTGGRELTAAIADALSISLQEAEEKKIKKINLRALDTSSDTADINDIIANIVSRWTEDIMRVLQFYKSRSQNNNVDEIYLYGGTSNLPGIVEFIEKAMNIPTKQIKSLSSVIYDKHLEAQGLEYYVNSIGAIIRK